MHPRKFCPSLKKEYLESCAHKSYNNKKTGPIRILPLTISLPESIMETGRVVLTFESVDEILWCDHSNKKPLHETSSNGTICFSIFDKTKFGIFLEF